MQNIPTDFYEKLQKAASSFENNNNNSKGVSDADELANHVWMRVAEGRWTVPEDHTKISYKSMILAALANLTGGSSPAKRSDDPHRWLKHGRFVQVTEQINLSFEPDSPYESDLESVTPAILGVMKPKNADTIVLLVKHRGSIAKMSREENIAPETARQRALRARKEFLSLIPTDSVLYTNARRLFKRFEVDPSEEGFKDVGSCDDTRAAMLRQELVEKPSEEELERYIPDSDPFIKSKKRYVLSFFTIKQYEGVHWFKTLDEAKKMLKTMTDKSIIWARIERIDATEIVEVETYQNLHHAEPIRKSSPVEKPWVGTLDGCSPMNEVSYENFD